ncbi:hypothetical protein HOLleu_30240 [Holothuria leucospilota]|uniref:Uncharacterized protein n=1 Tax=Holothuria leucospilota TaxID=206669 RepID=A0A9Q1BK30_HOLLE|nr:hypothetical protein HOLleu_30240 [Holothuria leucospilota]
MKDKILKAARNLQNSAEWKNVFISPDETKEEQKRSFELRQELRKRRLTDKDLVIYKGQIMKKSERDAAFELSVEDQAKKEGAVLVPPE